MGSVENPGWSNKMEKINTVYTFLCIALALLNAANGSVDTAEDAEPIIYFYIPRWETRTFSPRQSFLEMLKQNPVPGKQGDIKNSRNNIVVADRRSKPLNHLSTQDEDKVSFKDVTYLSTFESNYVKGLKPSEDALIFIKPSKNTSGSGKEPSEASADRDSLQDDALTSAKKENVQNPEALLMKDPQPGGLNESDTTNRHIFDDPQALLNDRVNGGSLPLEEPMKNPPLTENDVVNVSSIIEENRISYLDFTLKVIKHNDDGLKIKENFVFSPFSIQSVLNLLTLGSAGQTNKELRSILGIGGSLEEEYQAHKTFSEALDILRRNDNDSGISVNIGNRVFIDQSVEVNKKFTKDAKDYYKVAVESFNFSANGDLFVKEVNEWVRQLTQGKLDSVVHKSPASDTVMSVINALYFKGKWETPFPKIFTRDSTFSVSETEKISVPMMINKIVVPYYEAQDYRMIGIPYLNNETAFFVLLPNSNGDSTLQDIEQGLSSDTLSKQLTLMRLQKISLKMPKFKISSNQPLLEVLSKMGLKSVSSPDVANFSRISDDKMFLSSIHHESLIEVNEEGSVGAAFTIATVDRILEDCDVPFIVDRPFIFFIYNIKARSILFWGRVVKP